jgi:hypothetical protein
MKSVTVLLLSTIISGNISRYSVTSGILPPPPYCRLATLDITIFTIHIVARPPCLPQYATYCTEKVSRSLESGSKIQTSWAGIPMH